MVQSDTCETEVGRVVLNLPVKQSGSLGGSGVNLPVKRPGSLGSSGVKPPCQTTRLSLGGQLHCMLISAAVKFPLGCNKVNPNLRF